MNFLIADTVELFGVNFQVSMETVFTTLEHTARMTETTGENRDFKRSELDEKKETLKQAIAATLEESLCAGGQREGSKCKHHSKLVKAMKAKDEIISFNYDCLIDETLKRDGSELWNPRYGYGLNLGKRGSNLTGDKAWAPEIVAKKANTVSLYKLHGSLHFDVTDDKVKLKRRPYTKQTGNLRFTIIPPESNKRYDQGVFKKTLVPCWAGLTPSQPCCHYWLFLPPDRFSCERPVQNQCKTWRSKITGHCESGS